jgi:hypothetical protein
MSVNPLLQLGCLRTGIHGRGQQKRLQEESIGLEREEDKHILQRRSEKRDRKPRDSVIKMTNVNQFRYLILVIYWIGPRIQKQNMKMSQNHQSRQCDKLTNALPRLYHYQQSRVHTSKTTVVSWSVWNYGSKPDIIYSNSDVLWFHSL